MSTTERFPQTGLNLFRLDGKIALVTGAAGSLGRAAALGLARAGAEVFLTDRLSPEETTAALEAEGARAAFWPGDVTLLGDVEQIFDHFDAEFDHLDILINNAGINPRQGRAEDYSLDVWDAVLRTNLTSYLMFAQAAARRMLQRRRPGSIINITSIASSTALGRGNLGFGVSKAGVDQLTRELAIEWANRNIRVNAIQPCQFLSEGMRDWMSDPTTEATWRRMLEGIPMGRMGEPEEIVGAILFLASAASSMVTGIVMPVDGGNLALNPGGTVPSL